MSTTLGSSSPRSCIAKRARALIRSWWPNSAKQLAPCQRSADIDYAMLSKIYKSNQGETRYSPAVCIGCHTKIISGASDPKHVSTSYVERQNLTMRMSMRRFTRLTNAFSKKLENHAAMVSLYFMYYNFARAHQTLRVTPAMEAGISDHVWSIDEIVGLFG
jgi:hypothetical protein